MKQHLPSEKKAEAEPFFFFLRLLQRFYSSLSAGRVITVDVFAKFTVLYDSSQI